MLAASDIQQRSFRKLWEFEGDDSDVQQQVNAAAGGRKKLPTHGAVGARVLKYENSLSGDKALRERLTEE